MANTPVVHGRPHRRVLWEAHRVTLYMPVGGGEYDWVRMEDIVCVSGRFYEAFKAMNFPGFPEYDPENPDIEREPVYRGLNFPSEFEINRWLRRKLEKAMAELREHTKKG